MTDYRDVHTPNYNADRQGSHYAAEKTPLVPILVTLAVIAAIVFAISMFGSSTVPNDVGTPAVTEQSTAPAPTATEQPAPAPQPTD